MLSIEIAQKNKHCDLLMKMFLKMCGKLSFRATYRVVCSCLGDGNKLRQLFTNLLSSSPFSPLQEHSLFKQCATKLNVSHMFEMPPQKSPPSPYLAKKGKGHATLFSFQPSPARLIKPGFHKKLGVLAPDVYLKEKPRGGFYRRQVIDFLEWVSIKLNHCADSQTPAALQPLSELKHSFSLSSFTILLFEI